LRSKLASIVGSFWFQRKGPDFSGHLEDFF